MVSASAKSLPLAALSLLGLTLTAAAPAGPLEPASVRAFKTRDAAAWAPIEALIAEQKLEAARVEVAKLRQAASAAKNEAEWTRAIIEEVRLRLALHGYETGVRFLREEPWPRGALAQVVLNFYYATQLVRYLEAYSWEIGQREQQSSAKPVDLKAWTRAQLIAEALRAYDVAWRQRELLSGVDVDVLSEYVTPSNYPKRVRGTVRDALSYFAVELLANSAYWSAEHSASTSALPLAEFLGGADPGAAPRLDDASVHPMARVVFVLNDLERHHARAARPEAALEARYQRLQRLGQTFTRAEERHQIRDALDRATRENPGLEWWAEGRANLAEMVRTQTNDLVLAHRVASECARRFPDSFGGKRCHAMASEITSPTAQLRILNVDGLGERSLEVRYRNLEALYLRAYRIDLLGHLAESRDGALLPSYREIEGLLAKAPDAAWSERLEPTTDYHEHKHHVVPQLGKKGLYVIVGSARADFALAANRIGAVHFIASDLVIATAQRSGGVTEVTVLDGPSGRPVADAQLSLFRYDYKAGHKPILSAKTDAGGSATFKPPAGSSVFVVAQKGDDLSLDSRSSYTYAPRDQAAPAAALLFTDRSVYRPAQQVQWKVVAYRGDAQRTAFRVQSGAKLSVGLYDANNQLVEEKQVSTDDFGAAAGSFTLVAGRMLGQWSLRTIGQSASYFSVEEYKRPTFEVELLEQAEPARLNRPVRVSGEARYLFGLPLTAGAVRYRVTRATVHPWWWWYRYGSAGSGDEQVAQGNAAVGVDGRFSLEFTPTADEREGRELSYRYVVSVDVTDEGGETRSARRAFRLGFVAVEAQLSLPTGFVLERERARVSIARRSLDGVAAPGRGEVALFALQQPERTLRPSELPVAGAEDGNGLRTAGDLLRPRHSSDYNWRRVMAEWPDGRELLRTSLQHAAGGDAIFDAGVLEPGAYRVRYATNDAFGATYNSHFDFIVAGKHTPLRLPALLLVYDPVVAVGGKARLLVHSGLPEQTVFFERGQRPNAVVRTRLQSDAGGLIELPIGERDRGGFSVGMFLVRRHEYMYDNAYIGVPWSDKTLNVSFESFRDKLRPGQKERWTVKVRGKNGAPEAATAQVLAYMYDKSLDALRGHAPVSALGLYAGYASAPLPRVALFAQSEVAVFGSGWSTPGFTALYGETLKLYDSYGVGGLGRRGGRGGGRPMLGRAREEGGALEVDARPAPMAQAIMVEDAPAERQAARSSSRDEASPAAESPPAPAGPEVALRSNFAETAFFYPTLTTARDGTVQLDFTVPDNTTSYNVWAVAMTRDLRSGVAQREATAAKALMVRPYLPRFLREGDQATLKVMVNNAGSEPATARVAIDLVDPETQQSLASEFGLAPAQRVQSVKVDKASSSSVSFTVNTPRKVGVVAVKLTAHAGDASDGELRPLAVLPSRLHLAQSRFATLRDKQTRTLRFDDLARADDPSLTHDQLVVTLDAQLFVGALKALPYLLEYPYECAEQTLNRFVSAGILTGLYQRAPQLGRLAKQLSARPTRLERFDAPDPNRRMALEESPWLEAAKGGEALPDIAVANVLDPVVAKAQREQALSKLRKMQTSLGGFPWFPGGPPSPYMTTYLLYGFAKAAEFRVDVPKDLVTRAFAYIAKHYREELLTVMRQGDCCWEMVSFINYVLSAFPDPSWGQAAFSPAEREEMLAYSFAHWRRHSPMSKAHLALTLARAGRLADAQLVFDSVMDSAKSEPDQGTFWAPEDRAWLWYNDNVESHAMALRTLTELRPQDPRRDGLVLWLLLNKKLSHWKSTRATAEAIYSLAHYMLADGSLGTREETLVRVGDQERRFVFEPEQPVGKAQLVIDGPAVTPAHATITVSKATKGFQLASATWHYATDKLPETERGDFFNVQRRYFKRENDGKQWVLKPLQEGAVLTPGDQLEVQLSLRSKHAAEYVHLRDPRGAGFEPEGALSRYKYDLGVRWYEEYRDSGTNFFFEALPAGEYTFKYRVRVATAGRFRVAPAVVQSLYAPEFVAYSAGHTLSVK